MLAYDDLVLLMQHDLIEERARFDIAHEDHIANTLIVRIDLLRHDLHWMRAFVQDGDDRGHARALYELSGCKSDTTPVAGSVIVAGNDGFGCGSSFVGLAFAGSSLLASAASDTPGACATPLLGIVPVDIARALLSMFTAVVPKCPLIAVSSDSSAARGPV
jgi:hypothetical protein